MSQHQVLKGIVHPKMDVLSSFTHPFVSPKPYDFLSSAENKRKYLEEFCKQTLLVTFDFHCIDKKHWDICEWTIALNLIYSVQKTEYNIYIYIYIYVYMKHDAICQGYVLKLDFQEAHTDKMHTLNTL